MWWRIRDSNSWLLLAKQLRSQLRQSPIIIFGLGSRNRTYALSSQTTSDTISPYRVIYTGAPWQNRTAVTWLQNRCNAIILIGRNLVPDSGNDPLAYRLSSDCSTSELIGNNWYRETGSNRPHLVLQTSALPTELSRHKNWGIVWELNSWWRNHNP